MADNKPAFEKMVEGNKGIVYRICNSFCSEKEDKDDLAQEILYNLWKSYANYTPDHKLSTWVYRVAMNVAISFYRKQKKFAPTVSLAMHDTEIEDKAEQQESDANSQLLQQFINGLKPLDRALMLLYIDGKSYAEIAEILGISETNTSTKINRIKSSLKQKVSGIKE